MFLFTIIYLLSEGNSFNSTTTEGIKKENLENELLNQTANSQSKFTETSKNSTQKTDKQTKFNETSSFNQINKKNESQIKNPSKIEKIEKSKKMSENDKNISKKAISEHLTKRNETGKDSSSKKNTNNENINKEHENVNTTNNNNNQKPSQRRIVKKKESEYGSVLKPISYQQNTINQSNINENTTETNHENNDDHIQETKTFNKTIENQELKNQNEKISIAQEHQNQDNVTQSNTSVDISKEVINDESSQENGQSIIVTDTKQHRILPKLNRKKEIEEQNQNNLREAQYPSITTDSNFNNNIKNNLNIESSQEKIPTEKTDFQPQIHDTIEKKDRIPDLDDFDELFGDFERSAEKNLNKNMEAKQTFPNNENDFANQNINDKTKPVRDLGELFGLKHDYANDQNKFNENPFNSHNFIKPNIGPSEDFQSPPNTIQDKGTTQSKIDKPIDDDDPSSWIVSEEEVMEQRKKDKENNIHVIHNPKRRIRRYKNPFDTRNSYVRKHKIPQNTEDTFIDDFNDKVLNTDANLGKETAPEYIPKDTQQNMGMFQQNPGSLKSDNDDIFQRYLKDGKIRHSSRRHSRNKHKRHSRRHPTAEIYDNPFENNDFTHSSTTSTTQGHRRHYYNQQTKTTFNTNENIAENQQNNNIDSKPVIKYISSPVLCFLLQKNANISFYANNIDTAMDKSNPYCRIGDSIVIGSYIDERTISCGLPYHSFTLSAPLSISIDGEKWSNPIFIDTKPNLVIVTSCGLTLIAAVMLLSVIICKRKFNHRRPLGSNPEPFIPLPSQSSQGNQFITDVNEEIPNIE